MHSKKNCKTADTITVKRCYLCSEEKSLDEFFKTRQGNAGQYCLPCRKEYNRNYYHKTKQARQEKRKLNILWSKYRLREDDYTKLMHEQDGKCAICEAEFEETPHVDHDHSCCPGDRTCGKCVRGLLCGTCNRHLGSYEKIIEYPKLKDYLGL